MFSEVNETFTGLKRRAVIGVKIEPLRHKRNSEMTAHQDVFFFFLSGMVLTIQIRQYTHKQNSYKKGRNLLP